MSTNPLVTIDTQHDEMIHDAQLDYYAKKLATCSSDRTIQIFDITGDLYNKTAVLTGHDGPVWQVAWAHPKFGALLASCSYDGKVIINRESPQGVWTTIHTHAFHESSVNSVAWAPHELGLVLACASSDGKVSVLQHMDNDSWQCSHFQESNLGCNAVSWAPFNSIGSKDMVSGKPLYRLVTGSCDKEVRIWRSRDANHWEQEPHDTNLVKHKDWVRDVAWAPSTGMPCNTIASCSEDKTVHMWTQTEPNGPWSGALMHTFSAPVWRVSWSITGNVLAVSYGDHDVSLWKQNLQGTWEKISSVEEGGAVPPKT